MRGSRVRVPQVAQQRQRRVLRNSPLLFLPETNRQTLGEPSSTRKLTSRGQRLDVPRTEARVPGSFGPVLGRTPKRAKRTCPHYNAGRIFVYTHITEFSPQQRIRLTMCMLNSYRSHIGMDTSKRVNTSAVGVMTAPMTSRATMTWRR